MNRFLYRLSARLPCRLIKLDDGPYLERYYLGQLFGVIFYLHRFVSSDSERHLHNHPWGWGRALVLSGRYLEEVVLDLCPAAGAAGCITAIRKIRWWNKVDGSHFHRISNARPGTWTLFFHNERVRVESGQLKRWGFLARSGNATVFTPFDTSDTSRWWITAPLGRDAGREPIN